MKDLTLAQLTRLHTVLCLANHTWPNDPDNLELLEIVKNEMADRLGIKDKL